MTKPNPYEQVTARVIEAMEKGVIPWRKPWRSFAPVSVRGHLYRGINAVVLSMAPYASPAWLTFPQALEMGGNVRKGEKGWKVMLWKTSKGREPTEGDDADRKGSFFCTTYTVFNHEQCDGINLPKRFATLAGGADFDPIPHAISIVDEYPDPPAIEHKGQAALYSPLLDTVRMPRADSFASREEYYSTLFHELVHSTGHINRLVREFKGMGTDAYSEEELIAELGASMLCGRAGIATANTIENSGAYLRHWLGHLKNDRRILVRAASAAQKAVDRIVPMAAAAQEEAA